MVKIAYYNYWQDNENDKWISKFIKNNICNNIEHVLYNQNPHILICSVMGNINNVINIKAKIKILVIGENTNLRPMYNNEKLLYQIFDIILGFKNTNIKNKRIRFPLWLMYYDYYNLNNDNNNILTFIKNNRILNLNKNKTFFGSCVARHDFGGQRTKIYNEISKYGNILCPSNFNHNTTNIGPITIDKINFISNGIYNICPENSKNKGYCTEKIFHALESGTIPLYWGNDLPEKEILNKNCYCFINVDDTNDIKYKINDVIKNKDKYLKNELFTIQSKYVINNFYNTLSWQIKLKLKLIPKQKIYGISYASRSFINRIIPITNMANKSNYFDEFKCWTENDIDNNFKTKYKNIWNMSRGGGYWIWKSYIISKQLKKINDNDILIYFDSGCSFCITDNAKKRFNEYIDMINNHWSGLLRFSLCHKEKKYTNKKTIEYFSNKFNINMNTYINNNQLVGGIQIIRKNNFSIDFFNKVLEILNDDYNLFNDSYTQNNENHRHDQSIMSLLYKIMNGNLIIKDETYFKNGFNSIESNQCPIWATRLR
jgi:hypothetical protein